MPFSNNISLIPVSLFLLGECRWIYWQTFINEFLFFLGILGYDVTYGFKETCAPTGSVVDIPCTYTYPTSHKVEKAFWFVKWEKNKEPDDLCDSEEYQNRDGYLGNKLHNCILKM